VGSRATCPGCGLVAESGGGSTHAYIGASPGCWALFSESLVSDLGSSDSGHLLGDAYAVQHPGVPERRAVQSVGVHLVLLCAGLEREWPATRSIELRRRAADSPSGFWHWLDPTLPLGTLTIADVLKPATPEVRAHRVAAYVRDVWRAYSPHHETVRNWTSQVVQRPPPAARVRPSRGSSPPKAG
jgi:hypothetical protein